jgi:periplasmic protein TonB
VSKKPRSIAFYVYTGSVIFHVALALGAVVLPKPKRSDVVAIQLAEAKKKKDPPKPPPAPPPPPPAEKPKPKAAAEPRAQAKIAPQETKAPDVLPPIAGGADGFADLGISLGNADGPGIAVPAAATANAAAAPTAAVTPTRKVQQLVAPTQGAEVCNEPLVRPKRKVPVAPKYTMQARQAEIEGVVRIEVTVDESGHVLSARVLSGLGYGLDESAIAAAKATAFEPATRCGKAVVGTAVLPFRFEQT